MKIRLLLALVGLAISFAFPTFAQQKDTITDPQIVQQIHAVAAKSDEIFKKGDAAARAAMFTEDAVLVTERGTFYGRSAIENIMRIPSRNGISSRVVRHTLRIPLTL